MPILNGLRFVPFLNGLRFGSFLYILFWDIFLLFSVYIILVYIILGYFSEIWQ